MTTKAKARYRPVPNKDKKRRCGLCRHFREGPSVSPGSCIKVHGLPEDLPPGIDEDYTCDLWQGRGARYRG